MSSIQLFNHKQSFSHNNHLYNQLLSYFTSCIVIALSCLVFYILLALGLEVLLTTFSVKIKRDPSQCLPHGTNNFIIQQLALYLYNKITYSFHPICLNWNPVSC